MTAVWADLSTLNLHEHLLHSYSLALQDAIQAGTLTGFSGEQVTIGTLTLTSCVVQQDQAFTDWHGATVQMFDALTLPSVATVAALHSLPHFTPSLLLYLQRPRKAIPVTPKKKKGTDPASRPADDGSSPAPSSTHLERAAS